MGTIAFIQRDGLWIRSLPAGKPARLVAATTLESPRFSPSGHWVAYFQGDNLRLVSRAGGKEVSLGKVDPGAQWFPNRDELLVDRSDGLHVFTPANVWSKPSRLIQHAGLPIVFSPQGREIVYGDTVDNGRGPGEGPGRTGRLCRLSLDQPESETKVLLSRHFSGLIPCAWSGNGNQILFWEDPDFSASVMADGLELFRIPADGGTPQSVGVATLVHSDMLSLSPDRTQLAVSAGGGRYEWQEKRIAVVNLNTSVVSHLTDSHTAAVFPAGVRVETASHSLPPRVLAPALASEAVRRPGVSSKSAVSG